MQQLRAFAIAAFVTIAVAAVFLLVQQGGDVDLSVLSFFVVFLGVLAAVLLWDRLRRRVPPPGPLSAGDMVVIPVVASYTGIASLPIILGHNSLRPRLELGPSELRFGLLGQAKPYRAVRRVEARSMLGRHHLTLVWTDSLLSFSVDVATREWQQRALRILACHGVHLADSARSALAEVADGVAAADA